IFAFVCRQVAVWSAGPAGAAATARTRGVFPPAPCPATRSFRDTIGRQMLRAAEPVRIPPRGRAGAPDPGISKGFVATLGATGRLRRTAACARRPRSGVVGLGHLDSGSGMTQDAICIKIELNFKKTSVSLLSYFLLEFLARVLC